MSQLCPRCPQTEMQPARTGLYCQGCFGHWVAEADIVRLLGAPLPALSQDVDAVEIQAPSGGRFLELDSGDLCPSCQHPLQVRAFRFDAQLSMLACPNCAGAFIDPGAFRQLRKEAPQIRAQILSDLDNPLGAHPESLMRSLSDASPAERQQAVDKVFEQLERRNWRRAASPVLILYGVVALMTLGVLMAVLVVLRFA